MNVLCSLVVGVFVDGLFVNDVFLAGVLLYLM